MAEVEQEARTEAPGELTIVQAFVNSVDLEDGPDGFDTPEGVAAWLVERGLSAAPLSLGERDRARAVALREALRDLMEANDGRPVPAASIAEINRAAAAARIGPLFTASASIQPVGPASTLADALGRLLLIVARAEAAGTWPRLKVCRAGDCRWAFYDKSRNRSRHWCSMAVCGSRSKMRSYRRRQSAPQAWEVSASRPRPARP